MSGPMAERTGSALAWRAAQLLFSKLISLGRFLILARLLAPEAFGLLAIASVVIELVLAMSNVGIETALVQKRAVSDSDYDSAWTLRLTRALVLAGVVAALAPWLAAAFGEPQITPFVRALAFKPLLDALGSIKLAARARALDVRPLATISVAAATLETVAAVALELLLPALIEDPATTSGSLGAWALVAGALIGAVGGAALSYVVAPHTPRPRFDRSASTALLRFGRWLFVTSLVGVIGQLLLRMIVSRELGVTELGIFYLGAKLALLPHGVAGEVIRNVAFPVVSQVQADLDRARRAFQSSVAAMFLLLVPVYATMIVLAEPLVRVLGPGWQPMVPVVQLLALDGIVDILADASQPLLLGLGYPERRAVLKTVRTVVILVVAWPMVTAWGLAGAAGAYLLAETVQCGVAYTVIGRSLPHPFAGMGRRVSTIFGSAAIAALLAGLVYQVFPSVIGFVGASLLSGFAAPAFIAASDRRFQLGIASDFLRAFPRLAPMLTARMEQP